MARYIGHHYAGSIAGEGKQLEKVAPYALRGHHSRGDGGLRSDDVSSWQQLHLQVVRELHLADQLLSLERLGNQPRILKRGSDLRRDCRDEFLVARAERLPGRPSRKVDHT